MPDNQVFLDTSGLLALVNQSDSLHRQAASINIQLAESKVPLITSDWVLMEFLSGTSRPSLCRGGIKMIMSLRVSPRTTVIEASRGIWDRAFDFYTIHEDKRWSLVDCSCMLICKDRGITKVFTSDRHFLQFVLEILLESRTP